MKAYAIGHLSHVSMNEEVINYVKNIDETLRPFSGRFIIHGAPPTVLEGEWEGDLIVIEFPDRQQATAWYASEEYRRILPLRKRNSEGSIFIIEGVDEDHRAWDILERLE